MQIETKYKIGEDVYIVFKEDCDDYVQIYKGSISEIIIKKNEQLYFAINLCEEFSEEDIVPIERKDLLEKRIDELLNNE